MNLIHLLVQYLPPPPSNLLRVQPLYTGQRRMFHLSSLNRKVSQEVIKKEVVQEVTTNKASLPLPNGKGAILFSDFQE